MEIIDNVMDRLELARGRIREIPDESVSVRKADYDYLDFFISKAEYITYMLDNYLDINASSVDRDSNIRIYEDILGDNYNSSYSNPDYAEKRLGIYGRALSYISAELQGLAALLFDEKYEQVTILLELFLQIYFLFSSGDDITLSSIEEAIYYYAYDYIDIFARDRMEETFIPDRGVAGRIVRESDLTSTDYLYEYGEYISDSEIELSRYLSELPDERIKEIAHVYVDGFRRGFDVMGISFEGKKSVWIRYHIGQERIVRAAVEYFDEIGLKPIFARCATSRCVRRQVVRQGYESTPANRQFEYDHRNDDALFIDRRFVEKRLRVAEEISQDMKSYFDAYAGPAVVESFGEELFSPVAKDSTYAYDDEISGLTSELYNRLGIIQNGYLPGDSYSFTIIAFPLPDIGDDFRDIFDEIIAINSLDNNKYIDIQQVMIDVLDEADHVLVKGMNGNRTDIRVKLKQLDDPATQTKFENCTADVNIPLGEVFTSPVLSGTEGIINVSSCYLNGYNFKDISLTFRDGIVVDYDCGNFPEREYGRRYIKENILFNHEFLPMGEFAIGTNTRAYRVAKKYNISAKLPILIMEKTGPHFAVGDTCYSHAEDHAVFNPDGKEIISRSNEYADLRDTEPEKAYFNCHTDITIPYNELGRLCAVRSDGSEVDIIVEGRFVLPGTEQLNEELDRM